MSKADWEQPAIPADPIEQIRVTACDKCSKSLLLAYIERLLREVDTLRGGVAIRQEVRWFAEQMEAQLLANDHKPGWHQDSMGALMERLFEEVHELDQTLAPENTIKEAADVANFAMMMADNARRAK